MKHSIPTESETKSHIIISKDAEKPLTKFMIKGPKKLVIEIVYLNIIKAITAEL
jgi:hypothetical protein